MSGWALHGEMVRRAAAARQAVQRSLAQSRRTVTGELIPRTVPGRLPEAAGTGGVRIVGGLPVPAPPGEVGALPEPAPSPSPGISSSLSATFGSPAPEVAPGASPTLATPGAAYQAVVLSQSASAEARNLEGEVRMMDVAETEEPTQAVDGTVELS